MSPFVFVAAALAGGVGAMIRYAGDVAIQRHSPRFPAGIFAINATGSFALGLLLGACAEATGAVGEAAVVIVGTGLLGGYTTFSTAMLDVVELAGERRWLSALLHGPGMVVVGVCLAGAGWWCGAQIG